MIFKKLKEEHKKTLFELHKNGHSHGLHQGQLY